MLILSEADVRALVSTQQAITAIEASFAAMARGQARNYPVVREVVGQAQAVFGVKTGVDTALALLGLKACGHWPQNAARGLGNYQSTTLLFDADSGRASALVSANYLTGMRTGAAAAVATRHLARSDSSTLGLIGTGAQAIYQLEATLAVRPICRVSAWGPSSSQLHELQRKALEFGLRVEAQASPREVAAAADILITVTPSERPLIEHGWVRPGTHINAMGADTRGKQEFSAQVLCAAALFVDEPEQALAIGECQHAFARGLIGREDIRGTLGQVVAGLCEGRRSEEEITLFDGTGLALQDLTVADLAVRLAVRRGLGTSIDY